MACHIEWSPYSFKSMGSFTTSDGVRLGYREGGRESGPTLLFCYGLMCSAFHFKYQWEHFAPTHRLLLLDYRGHHISDAPVALTTLNFPRLVLDLDELLAHLKVSEPVTVVGHSMGVNVALEFFDRHPERVASLVLMAGAARFPVKRKIELERLRFVNSMMKIADGLFPRLANAFWRGQARAPGAEQVAGLVGFNRKLAKREDIRKVIELMSGFEPRVFAQLLGEYLRHDRRDTLGRIDVPTLILSGEFDRAVPAEFQRELRASIPGSELVTISEGSHCPQFDRPDEVNRAMRDFLSRTPSFDYPLRTLRASVPLGSRRRIECSQDL